MSKKLSSKPASEAGIQNLENITLIGNSDVEFFVGAGSTNVEFDSTSGGSLQGGFQNSTSLVGGTWVQSANALLSEVDVAFDNAFNVTGFVTVEIYEANDVQGRPLDGLPIAVSTNNFDLSSSAAAGTVNFFTATFSSPAITGGTRYVACIRTTGNIFFQRLSTVDNALPQFIVGTATGGGAGAGGESFSNSDPFDDFYFQVRTASVGAEEIRTTNPIYVSIPPLEKSLHTIPFGNYPISDGEVLYVEINREETASTNLTINRVSMSSITPSKNLLIIARREDGVVYFGAGAMQKINQNQTVSLGG